MHLKNDQAVALPCACTSLRKSARAVSRVYDEVMAGSGVTTTQLAILRSLNRMGPSPLSRLADALVMDRTSLYRTIKPMVEARWVSIKADKKGRSKTATLTAPGRKAMDRAGPYWDEAQARLIGALGEGAWLSLHQELSGVITVATKIFQHNIFDRP